MNFIEIHQKQKNFFKSHTTKSIDFRIEQLKKLKNIILKSEDKLYQAIYEDFGKSKFDTFTTEISFIIKDIDFYLKNLRKFAEPKKVKTNLVNQLGYSRIYNEPFGNVLIIGAWNYPYQLSFSPAVAAIAAGNTVFLKPSEIAEHTMCVMAELINTNFDEEYFYVAEGGIKETTDILTLKFDKIFFTGSPKVGKIIYEAAAKHLTPVTLELGGKSPAIVTESADLEVAAQRIVWGKFLNAGQTCVAPDYIVVHEKVKKEFLEKLKNKLEKYQYQDGVSHYTKIINDKNFDRLINLIDRDKIFYGGQHHKLTRYIEPTILQDVSVDDQIMQEEIFGPILPVLGYKKIVDVLDYIQDGEKPLAAYLFTKNNEDKIKFNSKISFGGGCINDVVMHLSSDYLPFGGVGNSGIGNYHGRYGFEAFSHQKGILERETWGEPNIKYPPYTEEKLKWIKKLL